MDISGWSDPEVLSLPGWVFGPRQVVQIGRIMAVPADVYRIVASGVPDKCVIWECHVSAPSVTGGWVYFELAWADRLPTSAAEWSTLEKMFPLAGVQDGLNWSMLVAAGGAMHLSELRIAGPAAGLRPALRVDNASTQNSGVSVTLIVSGWPRSVPDWLISGKGKYHG